MDDALGKALAHPVGQLGLEDKALAHAASGVDAVDMGDDVHLLVVHIVNRGEACQEIEAVIPRPPEGGFPSLPGHRGHGPPVQPLVQLHSGNLRLQAFRRIPAREAFHASSRPFWSPCRAAAQTTSGSPRLSPAAPEAGRPPCAIFS